MLESCKEQIGRIARHGLGSAHFTTPQLRDLATHFHGAGLALSEEADRRDVVANPVTPPDPNAPVRGILDDLANYVAKQQAAQTGEPA